MPNIKSAKKRVLVNQTKAAQNKAAKSALKTSLTDNFVLFFSVFDGFFRNHVLHFHQTALQVLEIMLSQDANL